MGYGGGNGGRLALKQQSEYNRVVSPPKHWLLQLTAYLTLTAVGVVGVSGMPATAERWIATGLLLAFGVLDLKARWSLGVEHAGWPVHLYLAVQTIWVAGLCLLAPDSSAFPILYFILSAQAMLWLPQRLAVLWIVAFAWITGGIFVLAAGWPAGLLRLLPYLGGYFFFGAFAQALTQAEVAHRQSLSLLDELRATHRQLQDYAARVEELAVAEERNRLAREMHDALGHRLTVAVVQLEGAQRLIPSDPGRAARMIGTVREEVRQALADLRRTVATLRAPLEADLPLAQALARLATAFQEATGVTVYLAVPEDLPPLPGKHRQAFYRAAQEALTNVQRHAAARQVWIDLHTEGERITLTVGDDGVGFSNSGNQAGFGLRGLRERAAQLGGDLYLETRPGGGAQLRICLPLSQEMAGV